MPLRASRPANCFVLSRAPVVSSHWPWPHTSSRLTRPRRRYDLSTYSGKPPDNMTEAYLSGFDVLFPRVSRAFNGRSYFIWSPGDPHILGAYSYLAVGQYTAFNGIQGRREGNLHFAGEQTSLNFQGYIEGALRSGYRCAAEVGRRRAS
jgi:monoamine oxidase